MASRGCPYTCSYCSNHALKKKLEGKYVRFRSVDNIIQEIELRIKQYHKEGFKYLYFFDDTFILDKEFVLDALRQMLEVTEVYGLLVMDRKEATIGLLEGKSIETLQKMTSGVPSKVRAGGQCLSPETLIKTRDRAKGI